MQFPKIIIPVHFSGQPTDQERIFNLSQKYKFKIIEDASHSIGSKRNNENIGSCRWSHITVFSFHPVKIITSGEGGMVLTNIKSIANNIERIRTNGITKTESKLKNKNVGPWYYEQQIQGFNFRMTELQAALGLSQLKSINKFVTKRNLIAERYIKLLKDLPIQLPTVKDGNYSSFHLYVIRLKLDKLKKNYKTVFNELRKHKINVNLHYLPVHLHPFYKKMGFKKGDFPVSEIYAKEAISIPIYFDLTFDKQKYVAKILKKILK